jgi:hypothetical protein
VHPPEHPLCLLPSQLVVHCVRHPLSLQLLAQVEFAQVLKQVFPHPVHMEEQVPAHASWQSVHTRRFAVSSFLCSMKSSAFLLMRLPTAGVEYGFSM